MLLDLDCKDPKHSLRMVLLLNTALSYANDASVSTWGRAFSLLSTSISPSLERETPSPLHAHWITFPEHTRVNFRERHRPDRG